MIELCSYALKASESPEDDFVYLAEEVDELIEQKDKRISELEQVADNQIWPSMGNGFSADYVSGYEQATADISNKLKAVKSE